MAEGDFNVPDWSDRDSKLFKLLPELVLVSSCTRIADSTRRRLYVYKRCHLVPLTATLVFPMVRALLASVNNPQV